MANKSQRLYNVKHLQHVRRASSHTRFLAVIGAAQLIFLIANIFWGQSSVPADFVPQLEGGPSISVVSEPVIDHGDLNVKQYVTSSFEVQDVSDQMLIGFSPWVEAHEGCCPPQVVLSNQQLHPGEIATVSMRDMMHPGMDGPHDLRIHVRSNDPNKREIQLTALSNWVRA